MQADVAHNAFLQVTERVSKGTLTDGIPPLPGAVFVGIGQSLGGFITMIQQGKYADYPGIGIFGASPFVISGVREQPDWESMSTGERRSWLMQANARQSGLTELPVYHGAPREGFRGIFHVPDVHDDLFKYDEDECHTLIPRMSGIDGMTPGLARPFAERITRPLFLAFGAIDVSADPRREPAGYPASSDITLAVIPDMAHMHNFADTRTRLWDRFHAWLPVVATDRNRPHTAGQASLADLPNRDGRGRDRPGGRPPGLVKGPSMDDHLATIWESIADRLPNEIALIHGGRRVTWREFEQRAARFAAALVEAGIEPGQTVAIDMYNCPEYLEVFFAALKIRAAPANVNYRYLDEELSALLRQSDAVALVYHATLRDRVSRAVPAVAGLRLLAEADLTGSGDGQEAAVAGGGAVPGARSYEELIRSHEPAPRIYRPGTDGFLSYTGGTTGLPKGVEYVIGNSVRNTRMLGRQMLGLEDVDWEGPALDRALLLHRQERRPVALPASPLMHSTGLIMASLPALTAGGAVVTLTARSFDPDELFTAIAASRPRTVSIAGDAFARPMVRALERRAAAAGRYDTSSLVTITSAGVAWSAEVKQALLEHIPQVTLVDACGSSEGATIGSMVSRRGAPLTTDRFQPAPGVRLLRADGTGIPAGSTEIGAFCAPTVAKGYRNDPERTAAAFRVIDGGQYVSTGDLGRWNGDGTVTLIGRGTSVINTGGEKVFPEEVEKVIRALPAVDDCVVLGLPDERFGQRVAAVVQPSGQGLDAAAVTAAVREQLAGYKVPRTVLIAPVPRAPNGKVMFEAARRLLSTADANRPLRTACRPARSRVPRARRPGRRQVSAPVTACGLAARSRRTCALTAPRRTGWCRRSRQREGNRAAGWRAGGDDMVCENGTRVAQGISLRPGSGDGAGPHAWSGVAPERKIV